MGLSSNPQVRQKQIANLAKGHEIKKSLAERFWEKVDKNSLIPERYPNLGSCWLWNAVKDKAGYGVIWVNAEKRSVKAPRVAYFVETGEWPKQDILHHCDVPACVRYSHLFEGSDLENQRDRKMKGRSCFGEKNGNAKLTDVSVLLIRQKYANREANQNQLAREFGVDQAAIWSVLHMKSWKHVPNPSTIPDAT